MPCTTRLAICGRSPSPASSRSWLRPASCCTAARCGPGWAGGARRCSPGARPSVLGGWCAASAVIAGHGWYHTRLGHGVPWMPVAVVGFLGLLLALARIPVVARARRPGHDEPTGAAALVPDAGRGGLPDHHGPRPLARAVRPARGPGRYRRRHRRSAGRAQARAGHRPPRRPVVQRVRHGRPDRGPDPRRPDRLPAGPTSPRPARPSASSRSPWCPTVGVPLLLAVHITSVSALARGSADTAAGRRRLAAAAAE